MTLTTEGKGFYLTYKNSFGTYVPLKNDSIAALNGFLKGFDSKEAISGGSLFVDLRLYGSLSTDLVEKWQPSSTEKAPPEKFSRVSYTKNNDVQYVLLTFDFSESFLKNYKENIVFNDLLNRTLSESLVISVNIGLPNQDSFNFRTTNVSTDMIALDDSNERVGILFTKNRKIQQYFAKTGNSTAKIKYIIYNYLPKKINNSDEYIPIRIEFKLSSEELNKLVSKNLGNEFPINNIEEIQQITKLQKDFFGVNYKNLYTTFLSMPINENYISNSTAASFSVPLYLHSLEFNTLFSHKKYQTQLNKYLNFDFFKYANHVFELKPDILNRTALPKTITFNKTWEGALSSIRYEDYNQTRPLHEVHWEILGLLKHVIWLFDNTNENVRSLIINRRFYLDKLTNILTNLIKNGIKNENSSVFLLDFKKDYNYTAYSGEKLSRSELHFNNLFARFGLFIVDFLYLKEFGQESSNYLKNYSYYRGLEEHLLTELDYYNSIVFPKIENLSISEVDSAYELFLTSLMMMYMVIFCYNFLRQQYGSNYFQDFFLDFDKYTLVIKESLNKFNNFTNFLNLFDPNVDTTGAEIKIQTKPAVAALCLGLIDELFSNLANSEGDNTIHQHFFHLAEKDYQLNSVTPTDYFSDYRILVTNKQNTDIGSILNNLDIISIMYYGFLDSLMTSSYGSTLILKTKISTNI